jgi:hypothetical protein
MNEGLSCPHGNGTMDRCNKCGEILQGIAQSISDEIDELILNDILKRIKDEEAHGKLWTTFNPIHHCIP